MLVHCIYMFLKVKMTHYSEKMTISILVNPSRNIQWVLTECPLYGRNCSRYQVHCDPQAAPLSSQSLHAKK